MCHVNAEQVRLHRDTLGRVAREALIQWAVEKGDSGHGVLLPYDMLREDEREADRRVGEAVARHVLSDSCSCIEEVLTSTAEGLASVRTNLEKARNVFAPPIRPAKSNYAIFVLATMLICALSSGFLVGVLSFVNGVTKILAQ